jgi:hypothetical protein
VNGSMSDCFGGGGGNRANVVTEALDQEFEVHRDESLVLDDENFHSPRLREQRDCRLHRVTVYLALGFNCRPKLPGKTLQDA